MERFFSLEHLTVERLRDLCRDALRVGKLVVEYDRPMEEGHYEMTLPEETILANICVGNRNHLVYQENLEGFPDATTVSFPLAGQLYMTAYIDIDNSLLGGLVEKYGLDEWWQMEGAEKRHYPFSEFYTTGPKDGTIARMPRIPS